VVAIRASSAAISAAASVTTTAATVSTATAAAATTAVSTTAATTPRTIIILGSGFIAGNPTSGNFLLIQSIDRGLCFIRIWHFDESEPSRTTGFPIRYDAYLCDLAKSTEGLAYLILRCSE
jgi:hypothetical protein